MGSIGTFNEQDMVVARSAHEVYIREINGAGFRWEFSGSPDHMKDVEDRTADYAQDMDRLNMRIRRFGGFVAGVRTFVGRPIEGLFGIREMTEYDVNVHEGFHDVLVDYAIVLAEHGPAARATRAAEIAVAQVVSPKIWQVHDRPDVANTGVRWYLEDVIRLGKG